LAVRGEPELRKYIPIILFLCLLSFSAFAGEEALFEDTTWFKQISVLPGFHSYNWVVFSSGVFRLEVWIEDKKGRLWLDADGITIDEVCKKILKSYKAFYR